MYRYHPSYFLTPILRRVWQSAAVWAVIAVLGLGTVSAASASVTQGYRADSAIPAGSLVSVDPHRGGYVVPANTARAVAAVFGVVVAGDDSLLAIDSGQSDASKVQVATDGQARVLVSTLGGDIQRGDQITASPFDGIGMKARPGASIIGLAQTAFTARSQPAVAQTVTDKAGRSQVIKVGTIQLVIGINLATTTTDSTGPTEEAQGIQALVKAATGQTVSLWRAILSVIIAVIALTALLTLVYASIYGAIISVGRNPLAKSSVFRTLGSVLIMALLTTIVTCTTIFLLLR